MPRVYWDADGTRVFETGVDRGMLYVGGGTGVAWNGLIKVSESSTGGTPREFYIDGEKYLNLSALEEYSATIEVISAPPEFAPCEGRLKLYPGIYVDSQPRKTFGFSYRTMIGDDLQGVSQDYKIHIVYNVLAKIAEASHQTISHTPGFRSFTWSIDAVPEPFIDYKPSSHFVIDTRKTDSGVVEKIENILYGTDTTDPRQPSVADIMNILYQAYFAGDASMKKMVLSGTGKGVAKVTSVLKMKKMRPAGSIKNVAKVTSAVKMKKMGVSASVKGVAKVTAALKMKKTKISAAVLGVFDRANTFEGGTNGTALTTANTGGASGNAFNAVRIDTSHTLNFESAHAMHGSLAMAMALGATSGNVYVNWDQTGSFPQLWLRFYVYQTVIVSGNIRMAAFYGTAPNTNLCGAVRFNSSGKLAIVDGGNVQLWTSTANMPLNQWTRVELMCVGHATAGQLQCSYYLGDSLTSIEDSPLFTNQNTFGEIDGVTFGVSSGGVSITKMWLDDLACKSAGPIGPSA